MPDDLVARADLVFDTIDFLDLPGLVALHDACHAQNKALITAVSAGFGAVGFYFPETQEMHHPRPVRAAQQRLRRRHFLRRALCELHTQARTPLRPGSGATISFRCWPCSIRASPVLLRRWPGLGLCRGTGGHGGGAPCPRAAGCRSAGDADHQHGQDNSIREELTSRSRVVGQGAKQVG